MKKKEKEMILSKPQYDIYSSRKQLNLFLAGQGSGKTHIMGVLSAIYSSYFPKVRGLICANTYDQLNRSTMFRIRQVWEEYFNVIEYSDKTKEGDYVIGKRPPASFDTEWHNFELYNNIISFRWGAVIFIGSLDNYKALDGMEVGWMLLDETKDTKKEALDEVLLGRLRQEGVFVNKNGDLTSTKTDEPFLPLYIFTSPAKVAWLNEKFELEEYQAEIDSLIFFPPKYFKKEIGNKLVTISSTYLNKRNLPKTYIPNQKANLPSYLHPMLIYGSPFAKSGGEFVKKFTELKHTGKLKQLYSTQEVLHLSFDFNSHPYITCLAYQTIGKQVLEVKEFCLEPPKNSTPSLCDEIIAYFKNHVAKVWVYGDPSGASGNRSTISRTKKSDFDVIFSELGKVFRLENKILSSAPSVSISRDFLDLVLENEYQGISLIIDTSCKRTIADLRYTKEAADGSMEKKKVKNPETGITYEPFGHCLDAKRYFFCSRFSQEFAYFLGKGGKPIMTTKREENEHAF